MAATASTLSGRGDAALAGTAMNGSTTPTPTSARVLRSELFICVLSTIGERFSIESIIYEFKFGNKLACRVMD
ncbi:hypothetical protein ACWDUH_06640 [Micromonospora wenchangensis]